MSAILNSEKIGTAVDEGLTDKPRSLPHFSSLFFRVSIQR